MLHYHSDVSHSEVYWVQYKIADEYSLQIYLCTMKLGGKNNMI